MLPRKQRVPRKSFSAILNSRKFFASPNFLLRVGEDKKEVRVAVSVSKKVSKLAVERNTLRRRVYAVVSKIILKLKPGLYLISAKPSAKSLRGEVLEREINKLLLSYV